jgi:TRAP-type C4-dicarboxylate transport system substrate-binding protein
MKRKSILGVSILLGLSLIFTLLYNASVYAQEPITLKVAHVTSTEDPRHLAFLRFANLVVEK